MPPPPIETLADHLRWAYANLAMAHAAVTHRADRFGKIHYAIRSRLYHGLARGDMAVRPLADDEKLKLRLPQACSYCGQTDWLSADHLIPTANGGPNRGENLVWACRSCNSSKGAKDALAWWHTARDGFPPILLLRRYLKVALELAEQVGAMDSPMDALPPLPFDVSAIPLKYPPPRELRLWVLELG